MFSTIIWVLVIHGRPEPGLGHLETSRIGERAETADTASPVGIPYYWYWKKNPQRTEKATQNGQKRTHHNTVKKPPNKTYEYHYHIKYYCNLYHQYYYYYQYYYGIIAENTTQQNTPKNWQSHFSQKHQKLKRTELSSQNTYYGGTYYS